MTNNTPVTGWAAIVSGPFSCVSLQTYSGRIMYAVGTEIPTTNIGHRLATDEGHTIKLASGETIYARSDEVGASVLVYTTEA